ncbi:hypothetical protein FRB98_005572 [Tulasnella sp. 332]|nr:hypothetical protein FRB98_005572 [Tulasnella sp. 332]
MCITLITHVAYLSIVKIESTRHWSQHKGLEERFHILPIGKDKGGSSNLDMATEIVPCLMEMAADIPAAYTSLFKDGASPFDPSTTPFPAQPSVVLVDSTLIGVFTVSKPEVETQLCIEKKIPLMIYSGIPPTLILRMADIFSDTHRRSDDPSRAAYLRFRDAPEGSKIDERKQWEEMHNLDPDKALVKLPGMPETYAYELCPQNPIDQYPPSVVSMFSAASQAFLDNLDGLVFLFDPVLNAEAAEAFSTLCGQPKDKMYLVGPQFIDEFWSDQMPERSTHELLKGTSPGLVEGFLGRMQARFGSKSVLYISFGSISFPRETSHLVALFETLISSPHPIPFIFSRDPKYIALPEDLVQRLDVLMRDDLALIVEWAPQQTVLQHPATSFFLSHSGVGSVHEAIVAGVPLILWPIAFDHPYISAVVTREAKVAFELLQVRTGVNVGRPTAGTGTTVTGTDASIREEMRSVFEAMSGQAGKELRDNVKVLQKVFRDSHKSGGARQAMERFGHISDDI